jgi:hypothetical protein
MLKLANWNLLKSRPLAVTLMNLQVGCDASPALVKNEFVNVVVIK